MNSNSNYAEVFEDKSILPIIANDNTVSIKTPRIYVTCVNGQFRDSNNVFISRSEAIEIISQLDQGFAKPTVNSGSGKDCIKFSMVEGVDQNTGKDAEDILAMLGENFVVQECLKCHSSIAKIYSGSVNTFRIITYCWKGKIEHVPIILRIGQNGSYLDNAHAGGMFIAVSDEGILHKTAFTEFKNEFTQHPDTNLIFEGYKIDHVPQVIAAAERIHRAIPQVGCINWDFTIDESGDPLLIEGNMCGGSIWLCQMAHGCSPFGEHTPEVLQWLKLCKSVPKSERWKYAYGRLR